jgi:MoaA/NifB/PqqE/SkfB family radical SAM enzyme
VRPARFALAVLQNRRGEVPARPGWCTWLVTYRCNARCQMCDSWRLKPGAELDAAQAGRAFRSLGPLDVVRLTGGEPFLREDLAELAEAVVRESAPLVLHVTTNGSFPERVEEFARRLGAGESRTRVQFLVSFDGLAEEHDRSRGPEVTFAKALETVRRLRRLAFKVAANHTVISPRSIADHQGLRKLLGGLGVDVQSVLAYAGSAMYTIALRGKKAEHLVVPRGYPVHPGLAGADVIGFIERELALTAGMQDLPEQIGKRYYLRGLLSRLRGDAAPAPAPKCVALRSHVRMLPDGRVPVCQFNTETVGMLGGDAPFDEVWHGVPAKTARAWVDACPGCWAECEVIPSALYTGDVLRGAAPESRLPAAPRAKQSA